MPTYNLIEYSDIYSRVSDNLTLNNVGDIINSYNDKWNAIN